MLNQNTIDRINRQIQDEIRIVERMTPSDTEKAAALDRAMKLKQLLEPNPSPEQLMDTLAQALKAQRPAIRHRSDQSPLSLIVDAICR